MSEYLGIPLRAVVQIASDSRPFYDILLDSHDDSLSDTLLYSFFDLLFVSHCVSLRRRPQSPSLTPVFPPAHSFSGLWHACKYLLDANTTKKIVFVSGDYTAGAEADRTMTRIVGPRWRELIDVEYASPGRSVYDAAATETACQANEAYVYQLSAGTPPPQ